MILVTSTPAANMTGWSSESQRVSPSSENAYDLIISGAGLPGASLALAAANLGFRVALLDRRTALAETTDGRTTAFMPESLDFLHRLGLLAPVRDQAQPLNAMILLDDAGGRRDTPRQLQFKGAKGAPLALNIPNRALAAVQVAAIQAQGERIDMLLGVVPERVTIQAGRACVMLRQGRTLTGKIALAADGRTSPIRAALGIGWRSLSQTQTALTARLRHALPHGGLSREFHRAAGPMTLVPVAGDGHDSALVWCLSNAVAEQLALLEDAAFAQRVYLASSGVLGAIEGLSARARFPIRPGLAKALHQGPFALVAEAAHSLPPLLAQGLNLSLKDVEVLLQCLDAQGASPRALRAYAAARQADLRLRLGISEGLNQVLQRGNPILDAAYRRGFEGLQTLPFLRDLAVRIGQRGRQRLPKV